MSEALAARLALVGSLPAVNALVVLEGGQLLEGPSTLGAGVRLLVRVVQHVLVVRLLEGKCTTTDVALVGGLA